MDETHKLPPAKVDALAERLQGSLERRRPSRWPLVATALAAVALLALVAWWLYAPSNVPQLMLVVFDGVAAPNETPRVATQLLFPDQGEYPPALLRGHDLLFFNAEKHLKLGGDQTPQATTASDSDGRAVVDWTLADPDKAETILVRYVDVPRKRVITDHAVLSPWQPSRPILLVNVEETLGQVEAAQWESTQPFMFGLRAGAAEALSAAKRKQYQIGYVAMTPTTTLTYRNVRGWVKLQSGVPQGFPAGPVLGRPAYPSSLDTDQARRACVNDLKQRFGADITLIAGTRGAASAATAAGLRAIVLDREADLPGAVCVADWKAVARVLDPKAKE